MNPPAPTPPVGLRDRLHRGLAAVAPRRRFLVNGPPGCNAVCLTFDDGPHPEHTPRLLDALAAHGVAATFFVVGRMAKRYPAVVRRIAAEGHEVGNHTFSHPAPNRIPARRLLAEARHTRSLLADLLGRETLLFRPPYGRLSPTQFWGLWRAGLAVVLWNSDPKDFALGSADALGSFFRTHPLRGGSLALLHDTHPHARDVLPDLAASVRARGLAFSRVDEWVRGARGPGTT